MNIDLDYEQRARLELISIHTGKPPAEVLMEAAQSLFDPDLSPIPTSLRNPTQRFVSEAALESRFSRLLGRR